MPVKVPIYTIPVHPLEFKRSQYSHALESMFQETIRVHQNFCTYNRWRTTDYMGCFSELSDGFLKYLR